MQPEPEASVISTDGVNYKKKYKTLKRKLRMLIYEQECFSEELRRAQRKLLRISRDKSFLLDRLLQYEKPEQNLSDSEATASSDSETEQHPPSKKKKSTANTSFTLPTQLSSDPNLTASMIAFQQPKQKTFQKPSPHPGTITLPQLPVTSTPDTSLAKKKVKVPKKQVIKSGIKVSTTLHQQTIQQHAVGAATSGLFSKPHIVALTSPTKQGTIHVATRSILPGHPAQTIAMTQEELERHLELKQSNKPQFMNIEKTPMLPDNIFSNENSNSCDFPDSKTTDDEDLVIDMP